MRQRYRCVETPGEGQIKDMPAIPSSERKVVIIGAGPAGLTAAYELMKAGVSSCILEEDDVVGGISRTVRYKNWHFDIGGHRFFTKVEQVKDLWMEVLGDNFLTRDRLSRIYFNKTYFNYPLRPMNALFGLGIWNSIAIVFSYLWAQCQLTKENNSLEDWISNRFGKRLYQTFFKTYTEKVWGVPCTEIKADWAAQRIKGLSLTSAVMNALRKNGNKDGNAPKTLIEQFQYPKYGPGMMWQTIADILTKNGCELRMGSKVDGILWSNNRIEAIRASHAGSSEIITGTDFISSMPLRDAIGSFQPCLPEDVSNAARALKYRDFLTVALILNKNDVFPDNWIYVHDPNCQVGRIQNYNNWSPFMVGEPNTTCLGFEYFCFIDDALWKLSEPELIELAKKELDALGLASSADVIDAAVVRMPRAYPMYDAGYAGSLATIRQFADGIENLHFVGRNGMHRYNNQDHSMLTAMLAAKNILGEKHDLWEVNVDQEYHESEARVERSRLEELLKRTFSRIDKLGFATAVGTVSGLLIMLATLVLVARGGPAMGRALQLLGQYFEGYKVSVVGAFIGFGYAFLWGFLLAWTFAYLRNFFIGYYIYRIKRKYADIVFGRFIDSIL